MQSTPKIIQATISVMPRSLFDPMPTVTVRYDNGQTETLFQYYPDEISFREEEFVGLTRDQAMRLRHQRDVEYLIS